MYTMAATAMSTVSMSIVGAYMTMLEPKYVVAALVLNMFQHLYRAVADQPLPC